MKDERSPLEEDPGARSMAEALQHVLGNTCQLVATTTSFRWNITGPFAPSFRTLFAEQCTEMGDGRSALAARIRALGSNAVANYADEVVVPLAGRPGDLPLAAQMAGILAQGHASMRLAIDAAIDVADARDDRGTSVLLATRRLAHDGHHADLAGLAA